MDGIYFHGWDIFLWDNFICLSLRIEKFLPRFNFAVMIEK